MNAVATEVAKEPLRIDIGCGKNKRAGFIGCDSIKFDGVDVVLDLSAKLVPGKAFSSMFEYSCDKWPWEDSSIDEAHCSHVIEHLTNFDGKFERVHFFNELYRVLKPGASCTLIFPHWSSDRYYGDPTHKEVISPFAFYYLDPKWRETNAPHADAKYVSGMYNCDFECTWGGSNHPELNARSPEYKQFAMQWYKEAWQDVHANLKARK